MPERLTPERIAEIKERAEKATLGTEGPLGNFGWYLGTPEDIDGHQMRPIYRDGPDSVETIGYAFEKVDAELCAHARTDIPDLCAELERLREENDRFRTALEELSRLGNEPLPGNSRGNVIAQRALAVSTETCGANTSIEK